MEGLGGVTLEKGDEGVDGGFSSRLREAVSVFANVVEVKVGGF